MQDNGEKATGERSDRRERDEHNEEQELKHISLLRTSLTRLHSEDAITAIKVSCMWSLFFSKKLVASYDTGPA